MKYFAKLDAANKVVAIHHIEDDVAPTEQAGIDFLNTLLKINDVWKQTFKDHSQRKNFAGTGYIYDEGKDAFIGIQPFPSWIFNEDTCRWESPVSKPADAGKDHPYRWIEETLSWEEGPPTGQYQIK